MTGYRLIMSSGPSIGKVFSLEKPEMFVGRDLNNDIVINDPEISRRHARFVLHSGGCMLEDLGSTNGTFLNSQRITGPVALTHGQMITFGEKIRVYFEQVAETGATLIMENEPGAAAAPAVLQTPQPTVQPAAPPPAPAQVFAAPAPAAQPAPPLYQQNVFADPGEQEKPAPRSGGLLALVLVETVLLILMCLFLTATLYLIDANSAWCIFPIWPASACP